MDMYKKQLEVKNMEITEVKTELQHIEEKLQDFRGSL